MPQSSLIAWLNQPRSVKQPPRATEGENALSNPPQQVPTSPQERSSELSPHTAPLSTAKISDSKRISLNNLPPNVELRPCTKEDIPHLKRLTSLLLPIPYPEKHYKEIIEDEVTADLTLLAVWHDDLSLRATQKGRLVGAIRCRLLNSVGTNTAPMLYLSTLALLSPFRSLGIATHLLHTLTRRAIDNYGVASVGAHVWVANTDGLEWYKKRGFQEIRREPGYYRRLIPQDAIVMQKDVHVMDFIDGWP